MGFKDGLWAEVYNRISGDSITTKLGDTGQIWVVWYGVVFVSICVVSDVWVLAKKKKATRGEQRYYNDHLYTVSLASKIPP